MQDIWSDNGFQILVDDDNFDRLNEFVWKVGSFSGKLYAYRHVNGKTLYMHRDIMNEESSLNEVDHINGNGLDNRAKNLRVCSHAENTRNAKLRADNTSGYKGVSWDKRDKKWHAYIMVGQKNISLGYYDNPKDAAIAYDNGAEKYHMEYAMTNKGMGLL